MLAIRSGKGLGDSLYLQSVARHLLASGKAVEVCTNWPDVFRPIADRILLSPFRRERIHINAHYVTRKGIAGTDQFTDCCISAGIRPPYELKLDWSGSHPEVAKRIRRSGKPAVIVQLPRLPMDRFDGYGRELLPDCRVIQRAIDRLHEHAIIVQIGRGAPLFGFTGIDLDLANRTTVGEAIDAVNTCSGVLGYCSFIAPLAESLQKPLLLVWSRQGLHSRNPFIRQIVPEKIFHHPQSSKAVVDDCSEDDLAGAVDALCEQAGSSVAA